ncbi:pyridoxal-phosphate dependent enzyme [bacterium]|nr:pyridoxal-phosphate dependent enzyme [bacterium]
MAVLAFNTFAGGEIMLDTLVNTYCESSLLHTSRLHKVSGFFPAGTEVWMKRDDELGFGIGGAKTRKYASLIAHIKKTGYEMVVIEGGFNSNNVLGLVSQLQSFDIPFVVATPAQHGPLMGNALYTQQMLAANLWVEIAQTKGMPAKYYEEKLACTKLFVVKEGAAQIESVPGLLSLAAELAQQMEMMPQLPEYLYIDAGTGITAMALLMGLQLLRIETKVVITLIAGNEREFNALFEKIINRFNRQFNMTISMESMNYSLVFPPSAKSFGSVNSTMVGVWKDIIQELKMPIDLTYTAKHFAAVRTHIASHKPQLALVVNCGSWLAARNHQHLLV